MGETVVHVRQTELLEGHEDSLLMLLLSLVSHVGLLMLLLSLVSHVGGLGCHQDMGGGIEVLAS